MLPIRDLNPVRTRPIVTWVLIALCAAVFVYEATLPARATEVFVRHWALVPARITAGDPGSYVTVVTSMFLHGGIAHVAGNLWFLRLFGDNVEDAVGRGRYLLLYLAAGVVAALAQYLTAPHSTVPMLGASGAIGGVLGAYAVLFPRARVLAAWGFSIVPVPALLYLGLWLALQFFGGFAAAGRPGGGVAYWAHVGGFAAGVLLGLLFRPSAHQVPQDHPLGPRESRWA